MNIIRICKRALHPQFIHRNVCYFSKNSNENSKSQQQKNENYLKSKIPINKSINKQEKLKQIKQISFNDAKDLRYLILGNAIFMGGIPFWAPLNIGICILNGGYILNRIGQETKKYLLLLNNNQLQSLATFRPLNDYLKIISLNTILLGIQSLILASSSFEISSMFSMLWIAISIKQKVLPTHFFLTFIPLFISIFFNVFSESIRSFLLGQQPQKPQQDSKIEQRTLM